MQGPAWPSIQHEEGIMTSYSKPDRCAWCCTRLTALNAAVVGPELVCTGCAELDARRAMLRQRAAMKATARGMGGQ